MTQRVLRIGRWRVLFLLDVRNEDVDDVIMALADCGAKGSVLRRASELILHGGHNTGLTYADEESKRAIVVVSRATSGSEFIDTLVHEIHHVAVSIADSLGVDLESETPAYISGDSARALAEAVCKFGCPHCSE